MSKDFFHGLGKGYLTKSEEFHGLGREVSKTSGNVVLGKTDDKFNVPKYPTMLGDPPPPQPDKVKKEDNES